MTIFLGRNSETKKPMWLPMKAFDTHVHIIGGTGKGKTTIIEAMMHQMFMHLLVASHFVVDRMGGFSYSLLLWASSRFCPEFVRERIVYIDAAREDLITTFHPLHYDTPAHGYFKTQRAVEVILRAWASQNLEEMPRLARWIFNAMWAVAQLGLTVADCVHLLMPGSNLHEPLLRLLPEMLRAEWAEIMHARSGEAGRILESSRNRVKPYTENPILRLMFGSTHNRLNVQRFMREGKIVILNLSPQNRLSPQVADAIGGMVLNEVLATARSLPPGVRYPTYLWLDEFQRFVGPDIEEAIPEVRQLQLRLILSHQSFAQLERNGVDLRSIIFQPQSRIIHGLQGEDADILGHELAALTFDPKRVKDEVFTQRQMLREQQIIELSSWGESEQNAESWNKTYGQSWSQQSTKATSTGWSESDSVSDAVARRFGVRHDLRTRGLSHSSAESGNETESSAAGESGSETNGHGGSRARTTSRNINQTILPVYDTFDELSRRSYYTFEEQAALWAKELRLLRTGEAVLRLVDDPLLYRLNVQRHAPGYLSRPIASILHDNPEAVDRLDAFLDRNDASDVFATPAAIALESQDRIQAVLHPVIRIPATQPHNDQNPLL